MKVITKTKFRELYKKMTIKDLAIALFVSEGTIKNVAKRLGVSKGKGNRVNHKRLFKF